MGIGIPKILRALVQRVEQLGAKVFHAAEAEAKKLEPAVLRDAFEAADQVVRKITSAPNEPLVQQELALLQRANDPTASADERAHARESLRALMGGAPEGALDPLPVEASAEAEQARAAQATVWDPVNDPTAHGLWSTKEAAGTQPADPVNFYVHGELADIVRAFEAGGWSVAAPETLAENVRYEGACAAYEGEWAASKVFHKNEITTEAYHAVNRMPVSDLFLNGEKELVSLEANNHPFTGRDHFRIFATGKKDAEGRNIYAIAASRDAGITLQLSRKSFGYMNHFTEPNADLERDFVLDTLRASGSELSVQTVQRDFSGGRVGGLHTEDGEVYDVVVEDV